MMLYEKVSLVQPISNKEIDNMLAVMKPVIEVSPGWYREVDVSQVNHRNQSYIWDKLFVGPEFTAGGLGSTTIPSFHTFGSLGLFKPTIAESLGAIRRYCPDWLTVCYFSVKTGLGPEAVIGMFYESRITLIEEAMAVLRGGREGQLLPLVSNKRGNQDD